MQIIIAIKDNVTPDFTKKTNADKYLLPLLAIFALSPFVSSSLVVPHLKVISAAWGAAQQANTLIYEICFLSATVYTDYFGI